MSSQVKLIGFKCITSSDIEQLFNDLVNEAGCMFMYELIDWDKIDKHKQLSRAASDTGDDAALEAFAELGTELQALDAIIRVMNLVPSAKSVCVCPVHGVETSATSNWTAGQDGCDQCKVLERIKL